MKKKSEKLVSRKGAKHVLSSNVEGAAKKFFRTWRLGGRIILSIRNQTQANELSLEKFPKCFIDLSFFLS